MQRREFIALLGGAAAWPIVARAQQPARMRRIGALVGAGMEVDDLDTQTRIGAFRQGLQQLGWVDGQTFASTFARAQEMPTAFADMPRN